MLFFLVLWKEGFGRRKCRACMPESGGVSLGLHALNLESVLGLWVLSL